jgi:hypothetical protein
VSARRLSAALGTLVALILLATLLPSSALAKDPPQLARFMNAIGKVESGGRYDARNKYSGAYGKYQIMPSNWPSWANKYIGNSNAPQTPENQERVARGKFTDLYNYLQSWPAVAHWWLTGSGERNVAKWSAYSTRYVEKVMAAMATASDVPPWPADSPKPPAPKPTPTPAATPTPTPDETGTPDTPEKPRTIRYQDTAAEVQWTGDWSAASYRRYASGTVHYATERGAAATLAFTGTSVSWIGPMGPTRGRASIYVDGKLVKTIDVYARSFSPRRTLFAKSWATAGRHTLKIVVLGTRGRPYIAVDEIRVTS